MPVKSLLDKNIVAVTAGDYYSHALTDEGDLYSWGRGEYQVLGDGNSKEAKYPRLNESILGLRMEKGIRIVKMKSVKRTTACLMSKDCHISRCLKMVYR